MEKKTLSQILADFAYELSFKDLPGHIVERAQISLADGLACALAGYPLPSSQIALNLWKDTRREGKSTVWANGESGDLESTAWVNCLLMHSILQDDMQASTVGHMGSLIIPSALAVAEQKDQESTDFLTAIVAAYEVAGRIAVKSGQEIVRRGFRGSPIFGTFAAAAAAGKLIGLDRDRLQNAISLAANFSCGILQASNRGSMEWRFQNGAALRNGIMAAQLAEKGLPGTPTTLEGERGFFAAFGGQELRSEILDKQEEITATLGQEFEISNNVFKPYATCGYNQIGVDVVTALASQHNIRPENVERVNMFVDPDNKCYPGGDFHGPFTTIDQAVLSKPFSIAAALKYRGLTVDRYLSPLNDDEIAKTAKRVFTESVEGMGFLDTKIEFTLKDGKVITGDQSLVDMVNYTLDKERTVEKFCRLTSNLLKNEDATKIVHAIFDLPNMSLDEFSKMLKGAFGH
jgi:2-methylcitrate dehydratase PrpD